MWPLERNVVHECVRIGRHAVERWTGSRAALALAASQPLPAMAAPRPQDLLAALQGLYAQRPAVKATLVLESAWLPLMLVDTGVALAAAEVQALVRHRLGLLYAEGGEPVASWDLRVEHSAGDRFALGYGLPSSLKQSLLEAAQGIGLEWGALVPAFAWGRERLRPTRAWARRSGWWVWPEQDRSLLARLVGDRVTALNAGAPPVDDKHGAIEGLIDAECMRQGIDSTAEPIGVATWSAVPTGARAEGRLQRFDLAGNPHRNAAESDVRPLATKASA